MKAVKLIMYSLVFFCLPLMTHAQKLHFIVFATTTDRHIGSGNQASLNKLENLVSGIEANSEVEEVVSYIYKNDDFAKDTLESLLISLRKNEVVDTNDIVWFYFLGHGEKSVENEESIGSLFPTLVFKQDKASSRSKEEIWRLSDIYHELKRLKARLTLCVAEACNKSNSKDRVSCNLHTHQSEHLDICPYESACSIDLLPQRFNDLFLDSRGSFILSSSEMGQNSYVHKNDGGIFTNVLCNEIKNCETENGIWEKLLYKVKTETQKISKGTAKKYPEVKEQIPFYYEMTTRTQNQDYVQMEDKIIFFRELLATLLPNARKKFRNETAFIQYFEEKFSAETMQKWHIQCPVSYYIFKATVAEHLSKDAENAFIYYSVAKRLIDRNIVSEQDEEFEIQLFGLDKTHKIIGYSKYNGQTKQWLQKMCIKHEQPRSLDVEVSNIMKQIAEDRA